MSERLRSATLRVFVAAVLAGLALIVVGVAAGQEFDVWGEVGKAGIDLGVIAVGGTVLTAVITGRQNKLADQRQQSEALRSCSLTR